MLPAIIFYVHTLLFMLQYITQSLISSILPAMLVYP